MGRSCREIHEWIEEEVEKPIEEWEERQEQRCREEKCKWWMLCLNKLICWFVTILVKVVRWVTVTVGKWVVRVVCETVNFVLDVAGWIINLVLAIPIIGGIIRAIWNWLIEIVWRIVGVLDFVASLAGLRPRKKMYFGVIIPVVNGTPVATPAQIQPQVDYAIRAYDTLCNIDLRFTGYCTSRVPAPRAALNVQCGAGGFFNDLWLAGSYFQLAINMCRFKSNWRRVLGYGGEIFAFVIPDVLPNSPSNTVGCSMAGTQDYIVIEPISGQDTIAHEIGHACLLGHNGGATNLMFSSGPSGGPTLTNWQISVVRSSRHCTYL